MKKTAVMLMVVLLCAAAFARGSKSKAAPKVPVSYDAAVCVTGSLNESEKAILGSWVLNALVGSGRFTAAEHQAAFAAEAGKAQVAQNDGIVDDGYIGRLGKHFGIRYVCIVGVASYSGYYTVSARILDTETAKITTSGRAHGQLNSTQAIEALSVDVVIAMGIGVYQPQLAASAASAPPTAVAAAPSPPTATAPTQTPPSPPTAATAPTQVPPPAPVAPAPAQVPPPAPAVAAVAPPLQPPAATSQQPPQTAAFAPPPTTSEPPPEASEQQPPLSPEDVGANIIIHSQPPEADVYIGERFIGKTNQPDKLLMPIGTHDVRFVKDDLEKTETMTFRPGENTLKFIQLDDGKPKKKPKAKS